MPLPTRIGIQFDVYSGDDDPDDQTLGTFNPLYPRLKYFGESGVYSPFNLIDLRPGMLFTLAKKHQLSLSHDSL